MTTNFKLAIETTTAAELLQAIKDLSSSGTVTPPPNGNGTTPPPPSGNYTDQNYPLTMQPVAHPQDPVTIGVGPDSLVLTLRSHPNDTPNSMYLVLDDSYPAIAGPLLVTGGVDLGGDQIFTIRGTWGPPPHRLQIMPGGLERQLSNLSVISITYGGVPLAYTGPSLDARGGDPLVGVLGVWDNVGLPMQSWYIPPYTGGVTPPSPNANPTTITGATINGTVHTPDTLANLVAATPSGGTLALPAGTWAGVSGINAAITIKGAGRAQTIIDASNMGLASGKGILSPNLAGVHFADMTLRGAACSDDNGAAIREGGNGCDWSASNVEITGCQDGILTFASNILLDSCNIHDNGAADDLSHEIYINGSPSTVAELRNTTSKCGPGATHALKSRAGTTRVIGGHYTGSNSTHTGAVLNFPNGGVVSVDGATIERISAGADPNTQFMSYASENLNNQPTGMSVTLTNVHVIGGGSIEAHPRAAGLATLVIGSGCTYEGPAPRFGGWVSVTGSFTQGA